MKAITIVLLATTVALSCALTTTTKVNFKPADKEILKKQEAIFQLLQHTHQINLQPHLQEIASKYVIEQNLNHYSNVDAVKRFVTLWNNGFLPLNEVFSIYNPVHQKQTEALFQVFYYANNWQSLYNTLLWARHHINPEQFVYALNVAVIHREDLQGLVIPAIYEIFPEYFFNSEVIQNAQYLYQQQGFVGSNKVGGVHSIIVPVNISGHDIYVNDEQRVSYFTEDIGLNAYNYYLHTDYPSWLGAQEFGLLKKDHRGEYYLYIHQQLLARYYLERLSNGLGHVQPLSWNTPIPAGYFPQLSTYYGYAFTPRENNHVIAAHNSNLDIEELYVQGIRLVDAIDLGYVVLANGTHVNITTPEGIEVLGNLIHGNKDSLNTRYFKYLQAVYQTIGADFRKGHNGLHSVYPSILEHPETQLRDPAYWQLIARVVSLYWRFKNTLPAYTVDEINFDGVKVDSVVVDKLVTFFDSFDADITNVLNVNVPVTTTQQTVAGVQQVGRISYYQGEDVVVKARQPRLNNLPFNVTIKVNSVKAVPSIISVYLGPKTEVNGHVVDINENREHFVLLDVFKYNLIAGNNVIVRESTQFTHVVEDRTTYYDLYKSLWTATNNNDAVFHLDNAEAHNGFPSRLLLPKGKRGGQTYTLFVHVAPYHAPTVEQHTGHEHVISTGVGSCAFGYPLDRQIDETVWYTPNMHYQNVDIYHKTHVDIH